MNRYELTDSNIEQIALALRARIELLQNRLTIFANVQNRSAIFADDQEFARDSQITREMIAACEQALDNIGWTR